MRPDACARVEISDVFMDIKAFIQTLIERARGPAGARVSRRPGNIRTSGGTTVFRGPATSVRGIAQGVRGIAQRNTSNTREYAREWRGMLTQAEPWKFY